MKNIPQTGKRYRPKTAIKGKRYRCATCHKRSPRPVKTPAPWYCPKCAAAKEEAFREIPTACEDFLTLAGDVATPDSST